MLTLEFKLVGTARQFAAIDEAIRTTQFIRNKCVRYWQDTRGIKPNDLYKYCALLAQEHDFVRKLNSMARQVAAERAGAAITRFYHTCKLCGAVEPTGQAIGLDLGLLHFYTDSEGEEKENPWFLRRSERALKRLGRRVSHKVKGSANRAKARGKFARKHLKVQRQRRDFAVKAARALVMSHDVMAYEDLRVVNMVKNRRLAKSISDAGWRAFVTWLGYLAHVYGKVVVAVPPEYTTQECSRCGTRVVKTLSERTHVCPKCGVVLGRDHNAARTILGRGLRLLAQTTVGHTESHAWGELTLYFQPETAGGKASH